MDSTWYLSRNPDVRSAGLSAERHYFKFGWKEDRSPHPMINPVWLRGQYPEIGEREPLSWFLNEGKAIGARLSPLYDETYYLSHHPDVAASDIAPLYHFLAFGWKERRNAHWLFSEHDYLTVNPDVTEGFEYASEHYVQHGILEGRSLSPLFWPDWYLDQVDWSPEARKDPFTHFVNVGSKQDFSPHPMFDSEWYSRQLSDVEKEECGLSHYMRSGWRRDLSPHPLFDPYWYKFGSPDIPPDTNPLLHFLVVGDREHRSPHPLFLPRYYTSSTPDLASSGLGPTMHYLSQGARELRSPNPMFDAEHYVWNSHDPQGARTQGLAHFLKAPVSEARHPHPLFDSLAQAAQSAAVVEHGSAPLTDYLQFRANLDTRLVDSATTSIPAPRHALLPLVRRRPTASDIKVSILVPTYNSPPGHLKRAIESVRCQTHDKWEMILVDDGSPLTDARQIAYKYSKLDKRIRFQPLPKNVGISRATNHALKLARGDYIAMLDHDDVLTPDALSKVLETLTESNADAAYTDQAYISAWNTLETMFHKPAFSPALLTGVMYIGHLLVVRRDMALEIGGFDATFDKLQDYEFMLRFTERTRNIVHVPETLYHWRMIPGSIAADANSKGKIEPLQARAVNSHLKRLGFPGKAQPHEHLPHRLVIKPAFRDRARPSLLFIVRSDRPQAAVDRTLAACNKAAPEARTQQVGGGSASPRDKKKPNQPFTTDLAAAFSTAKEEVIVYLDPLIKTPPKSWISHALMYLSDDTIFAAAPHLVDENGAVLAAGSVVGEFGLLPAMRGRIGSEDGHAGSLCCDREVSALNGFIFAVRADFVRHIGGLDTTFAETSCAFADLTLRAAERGLRSIAIAGVHARMSAAAFDAAAGDPVDDVLFRSKHERRLETGDPYYNPNFRPDGLFVSRAK